MVPDIGDGELNLAYFGGLLERGWGNLLARLTKENATVAGSEKVVRICGNPESDRGAVGAKRSIVERRELTKALAQTGTYGKRPKCAALPDLKLPAMGFT